MTDGYWDDTGSGAITWPPINIYDPDSRPVEKLPTPKERPRGGQGPSPGEGSK